MDNIPHGTWTGYSRHKCRCDACREASREYVRARRERLKVEDPEGFRKQRNEEQKRWAANNPERAKKIAADTKKRAVEKAKTSSQSITHGTRTGYQFYECRCDLCRAAARDYEKRYLEARPTAREEQAERTRLYRERHPDRVKESYRKQHEKRKQENWEALKAAQKVRNEAYRLRSKGIEAETEEQLLEQQGGVCAICRQPDKRKLSIDHCHETGTIRGLLCRRCNLGLGCFGDDAALLRLATQYLEKC